MTDLPDPPSRHERQQQTRAALIEAGREVFAELGYHAANLDRIARQAGFSKGAVYSNFSGKSELFLAVMDANQETLWADSWGSSDVTGRQAPPEETLNDLDVEALEKLIRGFALATLEFIAVAARDEELSLQLQTRIQDVVEKNIEIARNSGDAHDELTPEQLGALLTALDQGSGLLLLGGTAVLDDAVLGTGVQRLLSPAPQTHDDQDTTTTEDSVTVEQAPDHPNAEPNTQGAANKYVHERLMKALRTRK